MVRGSSSGLGNRGSYAVAQLTRKQPFLALRHRALDLLHRIPVPRTRVPVSDS